MLLDPPSRYQRLEARPSRLDTGPEPRATSSRKERRLSRPSSDISNTASTRGRIIRGPGRDLLLTTRSEDRCKTLVQTTLVNVQPSFFGRRLGSHANFRGKWRIWLELLGGLKIFYYRWMGLDGGKGNEGDKDWGCVSRERYT